MPGAVTIETEGQASRVVPLPADGSWTRIVEAGVRLRGVDGRGVVVGPDRDAGRPGGGARLLLPGESIRAGAARITLCGSGDDLRSRGRSLVRRALQGEPLVAGPVLAVREGPDAGAWIALEGEVECGRAAGAALALSDPTLSRRHAIVRPDGVGARVVDAGAKNGLRRLGRNRRRMRALSLAPGGEVRLGGTVLMVLPADAPIPLAVAAPKKEPAGKRDPGATSRRSTSLLAVAAALSAIVAALLAVAAGGG